MDPAKNKTKQSKYNGAWASERKGYRFDFEMGAAGEEAGAGMPDVVRVCVGSTASQSRGAPEGGTAVSGCRGWQATEGAS